MEYKIRKSNENDFENIFELIKEYAEYNGFPNLVINSLEKMKIEKEYFNSLVVENEDNQVIWIAVYSFSYYTWVWKTLYLDDIFIKERYRWNWIWKKLLDLLVKEAKKEWCYRLRQTWKWNDKAIKFYEKYWANLDRDILNCTLDKNFIDNF